MDTLVILDCNEKKNILTGETCPTLKHELSSQKVTGLCNLDDYPISVQGHGNVFFFCCHEQNCFQVLLDKSAPRSVLHRLKSRKTPLTSHTYMLYL